MSKRATMNLTGVSRLWFAYENSHPNSRASPFNNSGTTPLSRTPERPLRTRSYQRCREERSTSSMTAPHCLLTDQCGIKSLSNL